MSYTSKEQSLISGEPVELYSFKRDTTYWTYTSSNVPIFFGGKSYTPVPIQRSDIEMSLNSLKNLVRLTVDRTNPFAINYIYIPVDGVVVATIYRGHGTLSTNYVEYWKGYVHTVGFNSQNAIITLSPKSSNLKRSSLMRKFSRRCTYPLYNALRCTVSKANYKLTDTIDSTSGLKIVATVFGTKTDNWLLGGMFETTDYSRMITYHDQSEQKIKIAHRIPNLAAGDSFNAYAGCDHSASTCKNKYSNKLNYGGQEYIPNKNPFTGDSIES